MVIRAAIPAVLAAVLLLAGGCVTLKPEMLDPSDVALETRVLPLYVGLPLPLGHGRVQRGGFAGRREGGYTIIPGTAQRSEFDPFTMPLEDK